MSAPQDPLRDWQTLDAEWRRLRRIEAAARDIDPLRPRVSQASLDALAAALRTPKPEGEPE